MTDSVPLSEESSPPSARMGGRSVTFQDQHEIFFDHPLPRYQGSGSRAYHARSVRGVSELAIISERSAIPRIPFSEKYQTLKTDVCSRLVARGVVRCPDGFERFVFIYEFALGNPLIPMQGEPTAYGIRPEMVVAAVLRPVLGLLQELHNMDLAHGAIRADNLFDGGHQPPQAVRVGDCLAQSYLSAQPALYLPPYLSVAMPMGRGFEMASDDIYALGVACALLLRTHDTTSGKSDEEIFLSKLEFGTFSTLIESERLPSNVLELLRGMLHDDPGVRWTVHDINDWFEGKRTTRRSGTVRLKGSRHLVLGPHKLLLPSAVAYYLPKEPAEATRLVDNDEIKQWIRRSVSDTKLDHRYDTALESSRDYVGTSTYQERLACRVSTAMEPNFPIMFQKLSFFPDSIGHVLAEILMQGGDPKPIADIINDQTVIYWMNMQAEVPSDINLAINRFEQCQQFLKQRSIGYGIERCVYFLANDVPCLSPALRNYYVNTPEQLLVALSEIAQTHDRPGRLLDRHMIAFLCVRERKMVDPYLPDLNAPEIHRQIAGTIGILSAIQKTTRMGPMQGISKWIHALSEPLYDRFHDRDLRTTLRKKMNELKEQGQIGKMADLLFDQGATKRDRYENHIATREYYLLGVERHNLELALLHKEHYGAQSGREIAALIAGVVMALAVVGFIVIRFSQGGAPW